MSWITEQKFFFLSCIYEREPSEDADHLLVSVLVKIVAFSSWIADKDMPDWIGYKFVFPEVARHSLLNILFLSRTLQEFRKGITQVDEGVARLAEHEGDKRAEETNAGTSRALGMLLLITIVRPQPWEHVWIFPLNIFWVVVVWNNELLNLIHRSKKEEINQHSKLIISWVT